MSERIISAADLSVIENNLRKLANGIDNVSNQVDTVQFEVRDTKANLDALIQEFHDYVRKDQLEKNIQLAETRIVKVRQEIDTNFGHYGDIRRRVTGILQAVDVSLVKKETIENTTEEQMLAAPSYWLAPCLIALSSWLNDNKELADKAMLEALRRDDEKTSLFFALVTRRGGRYKASKDWLDRYFGLQDPHNLEREIVVLIDGFTNGIFGPEARIKSSKQIEAWIEELSQKAGFIEEQHQQWKVALESKVQQLKGNEYPYLKKYSPTWPKLEVSLEGAKLHKIIFDYFEDIFTKEIQPAKNIAYAVDALLDTLVSRFDDEELPLRKDERLLSLIIEQDGDKTYAKQLFDNEKTLEERVSFTQLLTNFAMHPEVSNASYATQKLSIALSKEWVQHAHDDITAQNRAAVPVDIEIAIDQWSDVTRDGSNEEGLLSSLKGHIEQRKQDAINRVKIEGKHWAALVGGAITTFIGFAAPFFFIIAVACFVYFYLGYKNLSKRKEQVAQDFDNLFESCSQELRATLAEVVDYRKDYAKEDENAVLVSNLLDTISPEQYTFSTYDSARAIIS